MTDRIVTRRGFAPFSRRVTDRPGPARHSPVPKHCNSAVLQLHSTTTEHRTRSQLVTRRSFTRFSHRVTDRSGLARTGTDRFSTSQPRIMHKGYAARVRYSSTPLSRSYRPTIVPIVPRHVPRHPPHENSNSLRKTCAKQRICARISRNERLFRNQGS